MTKETKEKVTFRVSKKIRDYIRKQKTDTQSENQYFIKLMEKEMGDTNYVGR